MNKFLIASLLILGLSSCKKEDEPQAPKNPYLLENGCYNLDSLTYGIYKQQNGDYIAIQHKPIEKIFMGKKYEEIDCNSIVIKKTSQFERIVVKIDFYDGRTLKINGNTYERVD